MTSPASIPRPSRCLNDTKPVAYHLKSTSGSSIPSATSCLCASLDFGHIRHAHHGYIVRLSSWTSSNFLVYVRPA
ncbi:hypothetical protein BDN71DRAFT_1451439 [Pleurotus eryngii]|uniref:Uncharacterized protein n=1 Tax=Pleurotus eryngii TaxID=5323 RepID=A0A9P6D625_PLEER|nr:hypothetical protein BDN71DRAFT_1451439 [Pleurotus eryngii]